VASRSKDIKNERRLVVQKFHRLLAAYEADCDRRDQAPTPEGFVFLNLKKLE